MGVLWWRVWLFGVLLVGAVTSATAQFVIKGTGQEAGSVTPKALKAEMHAYGAFATIRLEITFATNPNWANEVDFLMRIPERTDATGFAYWFGDKYVIARTVEKQRAASIYTMVTSWRRDPALVEMIGRRQFRVRIAPVDRSKDLRVEVKLVTTMRDGALVFPLKELFPSPLESVDLTLSTPRVAGWRENWGLPSVEREDRTEYRNLSKPYTAKENWRVAPPKAPLTVSVNRPATGDGTVLVSATATRDAKNVRLVTTPNYFHSVYPRSIKTLKAGQSVTFAARIRPGAPRLVSARIASDGHTVAAGTLDLSLRTWPDRAGVIVWGAAHVETLKSRHEIEKWGMILGIPTRETSWLAVPKAEWEAFLWARARYDAVQYWIAVAHRGETSSEAREWRTRVDAAVKELNAFPNGTLRSTAKAFLDQAKWEASEPITESYINAVASRGSRSAEARRLRAGMLRLRLPFLPSNQEMVQIGIEPRVTALLRIPTTARSSSVARQLIREIGHLQALDPKGESGIPWSLYLAVQADLSRQRGLPISPGDASLRPENASWVAKVVGFSERTYRQVLSDMASDGLGQIARAWRWDQGQDRKAALPELVSSLQQQIDRLRIGRAEVLPILANIGGQYVPGVPPTDPPALSADQAAYAQAFGIRPLSILRSTYQNQFYTAIFDWQRLLVLTIRDPKQFELAYQRYRTLAEVLEYSVQARDQVYVFQDRPFWVDPRDAYVLALRKYGPNAPQSQALRRQMERSDQGSGQRQRYRAEVLQTELEIDRLQWRTLTKEEELQRAELEKRRNELFARMGDPLIAVVAPASAQVTARLPDGRVVALRYNPQSHRWEHRFDLPPGTPEGPLSIPVWIRLADGAFRRETMRLHVDQTAPDGKVVWASSGHAWRLEVETEVGIARVNAVLPNGTRVSVPRMDATPQRIRWGLEVPDMPPGEVIIILTDAAHNRKEIRTCWPPAS
jgi:hypothetical protein